MQTRVLAVYAASIFVCLFSASFTVFSLYTNSFQTDLKYTSLQINVISIAGEVGLYATVPFIGYAADTWRLSYLGWTSSSLFLVGYLAAGWTFANAASYLCMAAAFFLIGVATSACYLAALVACTRLYPKLSVLSISVPTTAYGLSSLLFSTMVSWALRSHEATAVVQVYNVLGSTLFFLGIIMALIPRIAKIDLPPDSVMEGETVSHFHRFVRDKEPWLFLASFVLVAGPLEMYLNNVGLIGNKIKPRPTTAVQVNLFSLMSTLSRLCIGAVVDLYSHKLYPTTILLGSVAVLAASHSLLALGIYGSWFSVSSLINGFAYGSMFTLYPIIVTKVWGIDGFATYWGMFILGPAIGLVVFGIEFALDYQHTGGYSATFFSSAVGLAVSFAIVYSLSRTWTRRVKLH